MKLFRKTLLFFVGVIAFQAALTILLVTNVTRRANLSDAQKELEDEATVLYDGYNAWKRQIWKSLIEIGGERGTAGRSLTDLDRSLNELLLSTKVDALALKRPDGTVADFVQVSPGTLVISDMQELRDMNQWPYIELASVHGTFCMVGITRITVRGSLLYDVFLLKRIGPEFCAQLTLNRRSLVAFLRGSTVIAASFPPGLAPTFFDPRIMTSAYRELYDQGMGRETYNAAFQRLGRLDHQQQGDELFLGTFLSNGRYNEKLIVLDRTILYVSLIAALVTVLLSLFLSRNITHPFGDLMGAMGRIRDGALDTRVRPRGGYEIGRLFEGFNDMARELAQGRRAVDEALRETVVLKEYNEKIVNSIRAGIAIVNRDLVVEKANSSFLATFGLDAERTIGAPLTYLELDIIDEIVVEKIFAIFRRASSFHSQVSRSRDGRVYEIRLYPFYSSEGEFEESSGCVFMVDDISARTELEQKIFQAEKLSTISMLSAGMAHEINNPLGSILTNVQNLMAEEGDPDRQVSLKWIEQETRRIARIVQGLLSFSSAGPGQAPGSDVNAVVRDVIALMSASVTGGGRISIDTRLAPSLPLSAVSPDELKQVVINLLRNSVQAIEDRGRVLVMSRPSAAGGVSLVVSDNGRGIPREIIPRIFDPFFTTKANSGGTGLGLSVVYGIVAKYNGRIDVRSRQGWGTRFGLSLPAVPRSGGGVS